MENEKTSAPGMRLEEIFGWAKRPADEDTAREILLRLVEGAGVALYRHRRNAAAEIVPSRRDLFDYPGGFGWGYSGSGARNLSYAIAAKLSEHEHLQGGELHRRAHLVLKHVISSPFLKSEREYDLPATAFTRWFSRE